MRSAAACIARRTTATWQARAPDMGTLDGKVAVVTGGSRGIGRQAVELFAREGANIAICGRTETTLKTAAEEVAKAHAVKIIWQRADILDTASVGQFIAQVDKQ